MHLVVPKWLGFSCSSLGSEYVVFYGAYPEIESVERGLSTGNFGNLAPNTGLSKISTWSGRGVKVP